MWTHLCICLDVDPFVHLCFAFSRIGVHSCPCGASSSVEGCRSRTARAAQCLAIWYKIGLDVQCSTVKCEEPHLTGLTPKGRPLSPSGRLVALVTFGPL